MSTKHVIVINSDIWDSVRDELYSEYQSIKKDCSIARNILEKYGTYTSIVQSKSVVTCVCNSCLDSFLESLVYPYGAIHNCMFNLKVLETMFDNHERDLGSDFYEVAKSLYVMSYLRDTYDIFENLINELKKRKTN